MALTDKQQRFADEYLVDMNATQAYLRAGYKCSETTARINGSKLLTNANIREYITNKQRKLELKTEMTVEWVLNRYKKIIDDTIDVDPSIAKSTLDSVGKHFGMFTDKVKMDVQGEVNHSHDYSIEQTITTDEETAELLKQLWKRQASSP